MGYLDNTSITVDAIITKKGRELLSKGSDNFVITQFSLADSEIDYRLWNAAHTQGSDFYGEQLENMPIIEAHTDENFMMKYKLLSLPKNTIRIPKVRASLTSVSLEEGGNTQIVGLQTNFNSADLTIGYTVTLLNSNAATITGDGAGIGVNTDIVGANEDKRSVTITCQSQFTIRSKVLPDNAEISTKIIVFGNESGGREEIDLTITDDQQVNPGGGVTALL